MFLRSLCSPPSLAVGSVPEENGDGWEDVKLLDEDRDNDPEVWMVLISLYRYMYSKNWCENRHKVTAAPRLPLCLPFRLFSFFCSFLLGFSVFFGTRHEMARDGTIWNRMVPHR